MPAADEKTLSATDPRETGTQLRPGPWDTINERYPGSMIRKENFVPQARLAKLLAECRLTLVSSCGVHFENREAAGRLSSFRRFSFYARPFRGQA
jgi:hypothetical protein